MGHSALSRPPSRAFDTADPEFVRDPWPRYEEIRRLGGLVYNDRVHRWMVSDFDTVKQILSAPARFGSERGLVEQAALFGGPTMEFYDSPHHDGIRGVWSNDFRARTLAALRPTITDIVRRRLAPVRERLRAGRTVELVGSGRPQ